MKRFFSFYFISILLISCLSSGNYNGAIIEKLDLLIKNKSYFKVNSFYKKNKKFIDKDSRKYYEAYLYNIFIKPDKSNSILNEIIKDETNDSLKCELYKIKLLNHVNLFEYSEAANCSRLIINKYTRYIDSTELNDYNNEIKIWNTLKVVPKQKIYKNKDCYLPIKKDKVGLSTINVNCTKYKEDFIFDTGANFSTISKSIAEKFNMRILDTDFMVTSSTGNKVSSKLAIADSLYLGSILVKNVVFLVFEDKYLSFPQADYYIKGIIGFPVIKAMQEIQLIGSDKIFIPKNPNTYELNNFALDGFTPSIAVLYNSDTLNFHFDTGADHTSLYQKFYYKYKNYIEKNYPQTKFNTGGVGGIVSFDGYNVKTIPLKIGSQKATLHNIELHKSHIGLRDEYFHGNLGNDFIKKFNKTIISFKHNSIVFK